MLKNRSDELNEFKGNGIGKYEVRNKMAFACGQVNI